MPDALVFYHYFFPDDVAGAAQMSALCAGLVERGWNVVAMPCNRGWSDESKSYPAREMWCGIDIERVWRPRLPQSLSLGRLLNAAWMIGRWSLAACNPRRRPDLLIIGTDPVLSVLAAPCWRILRPRTKLALWCFDLYPEAAFAEGVLRPHGLWARVLRAFLGRAYKACHLIADIGPCMRTLLDSYPAPARRVTLVPWALHEPTAFPMPDQAVRSVVFGDARLALFYSGNFGRAHSLSDLLELARLTRGMGLHLAFSIRGNRAQWVRSSVTPADTNVSFVDFASAGELPSRLAAADIHIVTLREEFTGTVVPSKFFEALAAGRPVLFCGSPRSAIALWIEQYKLGWVLAPGRAAEVAAEFTRLLADPGELERLQQHCYRVYREQFAKTMTLDSWDGHLRDLLGTPASHPGSASASTAAGGV